MMRYLGVHLQKPIKTKSTKTKRQKAANVPPKKLTPNDPGKALHVCWTFCRTLRNTIMGCSTETMRNRSPGDRDEMNITNLK